MSKETQNDFITDGECLNLPRVAIGNDEPEKNIFSLLQGYYLETKSEEMLDQKTGEVRARLLHTLRLAKPSKLGENVVLWGCATLDKELPTLPADTKVQIEYLGMGKCNRGQLKKVSVIVPRGTVRHDNPFVNLDEEAAE